MVIPDHAYGLPVLRTLSLCTCCRHYPGAAVGRRLRSSHPAVTAFPENVVGSACTSSFSRLARRSLTLRPAHSRCHQFVARLPEGFRHFVTSMPAPVASGWSGCRVGLAPTGKRRLLTAHVESSNSQPLAAAPSAGQRLLSPAVNWNSRPFSVVHCPELVAAQQSLESGARRSRQARGGRPITLGAPIPAPNLRDALLIDCAEREAASARSIRLDPPAVPSTARRRPSAVD